MATKDVQSRRQKTTEKAIPWYLKDEFINKGKEGDDIISYSARPYKSESNQPNTQNNSYGQPRRKARETKGGIPWYLQDEFINEDRDSSERVSFKVHLYRNSILPNSIVVSAQSRFMLLVLSSFLAIAYFKISSRVGQSNGKKEQKPMEETEGMNTLSQKMKRDMVTLDEHQANNDLDGNLALRTDSDEISAKLFLTATKIDRPTTPPLSLELPGFTRKSIIKESSALTQNYPLNYTKESNRKMAAPLSMGSCTDLSKMMGPLHSTAHPNKFDLGMMSLMKIQHEGNKMLAQAIITNQIMRDEQSKSNQLQKEVEKAYSDIKQIILPTTQSLLVILGSRLLSRNFYSLSQLIFTEASVADFVAFVLDLILSEIRPNVCESDNTLIVSNAHASFFGDINFMDWFPYSIDVASLQCHAKCFLSGFAFIIVHLALRISQCTFLHIFLNCLVLIALNFSLLKGLMMFIVIHFTISLTSLYYVRTKCLCFKESENQNIRHCEESLMLISNVSFGLHSITFLGAVVAGTSI